MLRWRRWCAAAGCGAVAAAACVSAAQANPWGDLTCEDAPEHPECEVAAGVEGESADSEWESGEGCVSDGEQVPCERDGRWLGADGCYYGPFDDDADDSSLEPPDDSEDWDLLLRVCYDDAGNILQAYPMWVEESPVTVDPAELAEEAVSNLRLPSLDIDASPPDRQLVGLPTWLWVDETGWQPQQATASVTGLSVTATATPRHAEWSLGDGATVSCQGPGTAWTPGTHPQAASPDCGHIYTRSSAGQSDGQHAVSVTVAWTVTWEGGGESGSAPDLSTRADTAWPVEEAQTVITR